MDQSTDQLRDDIERRRERIGRTVDQIGNRVNPRHVAARRTHRVRVWFYDTKDRILGNESSEYPWQERQSQDRQSSVTDRASEMADRASERVSDFGDEASEKLQSAEDTIAETPEMVRRQTRGNPLAAGLIALGAGALIGSVLPETRAEQRALKQAEPAMERVREEASERGRAIAEDLGDSARESAQEVKEEAQQSGERLQQEAQEAVHRTRDRNE